MHLTALDLLASLASQLPYVFLLPPLLWLLFCCLVCLKVVSHLRFDIPSVIRRLLYWWVPYGYLEKQDLPLLLLSVLGVGCLLSWWCFPVHLKMRSMAAQGDSSLFTSVACMYVGFPLALHVLFVSWVSCKTWHAHINQDKNGFN